MTSEMTLSELLQWNKFFEQRAREPEPDEPDWSNPETLKEVFKL